MAPFKMPMIMWNITTFPIERLCFDLKLKVLEELDAKDVIELVKVNQGFQWMLSSRPSITFGHHVHEIEFDYGPSTPRAINIRELNSESLKVSLDVIRHFPFIKNIRSCDQLCQSGGYYNGQVDKDHAAFLRQLEAVNSLDLMGCCPGGLDLLSHLPSKIKIKRYAGLRGSYQNPSIKDLHGHFIEARLNECELVELECRDDDELQFYHNAFIKTHSKYVVIGCCYGNIVLPAIQRIVSRGIASKNPAASVKICGNLRTNILWYERIDMEATIVVFLTGYPGMKQIKGKNRRPLFALAMEF